MYSLQFKNLGEKDPLEKMASNKPRLSLSSMIHPFGKTFVLTVFWSVLIGFLGKIKINTTYPISFWFVMTNV